MHLTVHVIENRKIVVFCGINILGNNKDESKMFTRAKWATTSMSICLNILHYSYNTNDFLATPLLAQLM